MMSARLRAKARIGVTHVAVAFLAMGGWAVFANRAYPMPRPLAAGLVQGTLSALLTLFLKTVIDRLGKRFSGLAGLWAPPLIACATTTTVLAAIHTMAGTPEIARTIVVPLAVSTTYSAAYSYSIYRRRTQ